MKKTLDINPGVEKGFFSRCRYLHIADHGLQGDSLKAEVEGCFFLISLKAEVEGCFFLMVERASDKAVFWTTNTYFLNSVLDKKADVIADYVEAKLCIAWLKLEQLGRDQYDAAAVRSRNQFDEQPGNMLAGDGSRFACMVPHYDRLMPLFAEAYGCEYV